MSNIEYQPVIKFFTRKGLNATEISKELDSVSKDDALSYRIVTKCLAQFKHPQRVFEDSPRTGPTSTITTDQNIQAVQRIAMRDRQISVCHVDYELSVPTTTIYEIISKHLEMKKASTRWIRKLFTSIHRANRADCYQELLQESEINLDNYFHRIVTGDEICLYYYDLLNQ